MANALNGKIVAMRLNGVRYKCQQDITINLNADTTTPDPCKVEEGDTSGITWAQPFITQKNWDASMSAQQFLDSLAANNNSIVPFFIDTDLAVSVEVLTTTSANKDAYDFLFEGDALLTGLTLNYPTDDVSTYDLTLTGVGAPTYTAIPRTT